MSLFFEMYDIKLQDNIFEIKNYIHFRTKMYCLIRM